MACIAFYASTENFTHFVDYSQVVMPMQITSDRVDRPADIVYELHSSHSTMDI